MSRPVIGLVGGGAWGLALAIAITRAGYGVRLWAHRAERRDSLRLTRRNESVLPGIELPESIEIVDTLSECAADGALLLVTPSHALIDTVNAALTAGVALKTLVWASKGLAADGSLISDQLRTIVPEACGLAMISGPTFAMEVARGLPTAIEVGADSAGCADEVCQWLASPSFRPYANHDLVAVQIGGASKNVLAIAAGISDALGLGANSRAALITRGLSEMGRLVEALGGRSSSLMGLAGLGDLLLTATDNQSRNRRFGCLLGENFTPAQALEKLGHAVEGYYAAATIQRRAEALGIDLPITQEVYAVLYQQRDVREAVERLVSRPLPSQ
ncbi:NAD(P)-dependent glycerol-3-phosphate dehydrogenase [Gammaproteobacteria bacterium]|nr:NAD(P)-dependent glycerol-3-phosphate dehydrogenase [Gammaproteobacteria bacterium]